MTLQLSCGCSHLPSPVPAGPSWLEPLRFSKWGFLLHSPPAQKVVRTAFKGSHIFCLLNTECSGLVSLKKGLVVNHCDSISSWESRFFLSTQWRTPNAGGPENTASLSFPQGHMNREGCVRFWQHKEAVVPAQTNRIWDTRPPAAAVWVPSQMLKLPDLCYASHIDLGERQIVRSHENVHYIANWGQSFEESYVRKNYPLFRVCERAHTCVHSGVVKWRRVT